MNKKSTPILKSQGGFTLVEIIAVLVILGILAAVATPKFIDMQTEAKKNAANAAIAEVKARLSMAYGSYLLKKGTEPANPRDIATELNDTNVLPTGNNNAGYDLGDFTVRIQYVGGNTDEVRISQVRLKSDPNTNIAIDPDPAVWEMP